MIRDILHRLGERFPRRVLVWPVPVQGDRCAPEVAAAIAGFNALPVGGPVPRPDLLIVARGGGSIEDLWGFNEEIVVRAAAASRIPLISAVGHETDTTLIDLVSDRRAPTPTAAAEIAVPVRLELLAGVAGLEERRRGALARALDQRRQRLRDLARGLPRPEALTAERAQRLDGLGLRLPRALTALARERRLRLAQGPAGRLGPGLLERAVERGRHGLERVARALPRALDATTDRGRHALLRAGQGLDPTRLRRAIERLDERLEARTARLDRAGAAIPEVKRRDLTGLARTLDNLDPHRVLARGFAIVRDERGHVLPRAEAAAGAKGFEIEFADGRLRAKPERRRRGDPSQGSLF